MTLPNFFIIGAAKSGTSSLYMYLKQHPEIYMSPVKEPHYFSFDDETKLTKGPGDPINKAITDFNQYQALFDKVSCEKAIGEASTSYLYRPEAPIRIHALLPEAKLIAVLRNPIERAFSAYMHVVRDRRETSENFLDALSREEERKAAGWEPIWHFSSVGLYAEQLSRYFALFPKDQLQIYLYEELQENQTALVRKVFQFLEVDDSFIPESSMRYNVTGEQKSKIYHSITDWLFTQPNPIRWFSRKVLPDIWRGNVASWMRQRNLKKHQIPQTERNILVEYFRKEIKELQSLINKDLSHWMET